MGYNFQAGSDCLYMQQIEFDHSFYPIKLKKCLDNLEKYLKEYFSMEYH